MIIERNQEEVVVRLSGDLDVGDLQDVADWLEFKELTKKSKATQQKVDNLVRKIKKGRWSRDPD